MLALLFSVLFTSPSSMAAYTNYSSVLLGDRAAGMGGAYTALAGDAAATPFYNPATTILQEGSSFSGSVHVYNKYETNIGQAGDLAGAPARLNKGFFRSLPSASGTILNFKKFAIGLSIVVPDYDFYDGQIQNDTSAISSLNFVDESLWVGGTYSMRLSDRDSFGLSLYYTSRNLSRSITDRISLSATSSVITIEQKNMYSNNLVGVLGYHRQLGDFWAVGLSYRPPSVQIAGDGSYFKSTTTTTPYNDVEINHGGLKAITKIPQRIGIGIAREEPEHYSLALDVQWYGALNYKDFPEFDDGTDDLHYKQIANVALGYEQWLRKWLSVRAGVYTNLASTAEPDPNSPYLQEDQINMYGFSANVSIRAHEQTSFTFGGYYSGGSGISTQYVASKVRVVSKTNQIFTMLIGTGFHF